MAERLSGIEFPEDQLLRAAELFVDRLVEFKDEGGPETREITADEIDAEVLADLTAA